MAAALHPRAMLLGNLFRDQLDRYGELDAIADRWAAVVAAQPAGTKLVLNADDPLVADLGRDRDRGRCYFGVDDDRSRCPRFSTPPTPSTAAAAATPTSTTPPTSGTWAATTARTAARTRPEPQVVAARRRAARRARGPLRAPHARRARPTSTLPLPGLYNVYNALGGGRAGRSPSTCPLDDVVAGLEAVAPAFGRAETVRAGGRDLVLLLVKNPAGANEVLRTLALEDGQLDLLGVLNDRTADGRDVSWVWDADFELLAAARAAR